MGDWKEGVKQRGKRVEHRVYHLHKQMKQHGKRLQYQVYYFLRWIWRNSESRVVTII
ncbi:hypothetical protein EI42_05408 [Thermosporothrix hazakensis]|uniref:Uncharacterized protein n=1 Tax=Thermosporothrix hazakensis TaxID=644383 RepID=A0A326U857_THEHA|nr:hypothetical protein [Thermosporothrix hazakensis]PZW22502.1 hypothetical protein EI42_05408 [Thermosporothrix hazakensis]